MNPDARTIDELKAGLPRARGDEPAPPATKPAGEKATPRARGWTTDRVLRRRCGELFPACAGIHLFPAPLRKADPRLPRARGDEPMVATVRDQSRRLPRARGDEPGCCKRSDSARWAAPRARG